MVRLQFIIRKKKQKIFPQVFAPQNLNLRIQVELKKIKQMKVHKK